MKRPPWNRTARRSRVIKDESHYKTLLRKLSARLGYPLYYEEFVIYIDEPARVRIILTKTDLLLRWTEIPDWNEHHSLRRTIHLSPDNLKDKLWFLTERVGNRGKFSVAKVLTFPENDANTMRLEIRPSTLIGPTITLAMPTDGNDQDDSASFDRTFLEIDEHLLPNEALIERANHSSATLPDDEILRHGISQNPILNEKIQDFCRRNGILHTTSRYNSYRKLLSAKDNDYTAYEEMFETLTGTKLLDVSSHAELLHDCPRVTVIIPCFNTEQTISRVLLAIASQALPHAVFEKLEVILVDDQSQLPVSQVVIPNSYPFRIEILRLESNHGVSNARMLGVAHASGDILIFLDSDVLPSRHYFADHIIRNQLISDAVFVSFKQNIDPQHEAVTDDLVRQGLERPDYSKDLRIHKIVSPTSVGNYKVTKEETVNILEDTGFFKAFPGSRNFGVYDLSTMIIGHNFTIRRQSVLKSSPFSKAFQGWGMEDVYLGLRVILTGCYVIPVLSSGVYHLDHPPRSGSEQQKRKEYRRNTEMIEKILDSVFE
jgi:glycosyltransferase involved in cell wall biosynthesis